MSAELLSIINMDTQTNEVENTDNSINLSQESKSESMNDDSKVGKESLSDGSKVSIESAGENFNLLFTQTLLLLDRNDKVKIVLPDSVYNWELHVNFTDDELVAPFNLNYVIEERIIKVTLNKWYADSWVENHDPMILETKSKNVSLRIKFRSSANNSLSNRILIVTVWSLHQ